VFVGKEGGGASVPQERTESLMIERALAGRTVVRLKGGDPFVFARGGEEALALRAAGVPFEVVPGVTAGVGGCAYAGIPVTHRGLASAVALVTGHEDPAKDGVAIDWAALAAFPGTLVFYMGVRRVAQIAEQLIAAGRARSDPAAVVENGTLPSQRVVTGTLQTIAARAEAERLRPPSIIVVGRVAALAEQLAWLEPLPLGGRTVAVTRARAQASELARRLEALGASVVQAPVIRIEKLPGPAFDPSPYDLICLTSANGVGALFERIAAAGLDARSLAGARVAAIGPATAHALAEHGITADVVPQRFQAEALVEALATVQASRALVARARDARDVLPDALRARGIEVDVLSLYETVAEPLSAQDLQAARSADYVTFTSSSTVRFFLAAVVAADGRVVAGHTTSARGSSSREPTASLLSADTRIVSIGPITSEALREHGLEPHVQAERHDIDGVVDALLADATARSSAAAAAGAL
jgi:uroporphyrinogen III methyltransferase/synthase